MLIKHCVVSLFSIELGKGKWGKVYLGQIRDDHPSAKSQWVAVKTLQTDDADQQAKDVFVRELQQLAALNHPNVVKFLGGDATQHMLIMEFVDASNSYSFGVFYLFLNDLGLWEAVTLSPLFAPRTQP